MSENPNSTPDTRKEEIIQKSPLLRAFLDPLVQTDPEMWANIVNSEFTKVNAELTKRFGDNHEIVGFMPLVAMGIAFDIFEPSISQDGRNGTICILAGLGYEIGDLDDIPRFFSNIVFQLGCAGILNPDPNEQATKIKCLWAAIYTGTKWKKHINENVPPAFANFIHDLNLDLDNKGN